MRLPEKPGQGGCCQSLVLALAEHLVESTIDRRSAIQFLAAATDGSDGNTEQAGACVDVGSWQRIQRHGLDPGACFASADAYTALEVSRDLLATGPRDSNVMDLMRLFNTGLR